MFASLDPNYIEDVKLLSEHSPFKIADWYNPDYYDDNPAIIKI